MYVTVAEFRGSGTMSPTAQATTNALPDAQAAILIERASRIFDLACGLTPRYFEAADSTASERTFYGDGTNFLRLDPYIPGSLTATLTYPDGYTALDYVERDGYLLTTDSAGVLSSRSLTFRYGWYRGVPIKVTAKWGFEFTPEDVKHAVIELAVNLWRETDPANVKLVNLEGQPLRETLPPRVAAIARRYRVRSGVLV